MIRALRRLLTRPDLTHEYRKSLVRGSHYPSISQVRQKLGLAEVMRVKKFRERFGGTTEFPQDNYLLEGRVLSIRKAGKGMYFIDIVQDDVNVQVLAANKLMGISGDEFAEIHGFFKVGDYIAARGYASRTKTGELTLKLNKPVEMLTPCLNTIPNRMVDRGLINNNRVVNYLVNPASKNPIVIKSKIVQAIRKFLVDREFLEVLTPILSGQGTGANATPFITHYKSTPVHLRVAPELWLKRFVIAGFDKVFEIGSNFRNEGVDLTHNPEFSTCEFYQAYTSLEELMEMTEEMFRYVFGVVGMEVKEFKRYEFLPTLEERTGLAIPDTLEGLVEVHQKLGLEVPPQPNPVKLLDNLAEVYLESLCKDHPNTPVFIYNQPEVMSPLAKSTTDANGNRISSRFELFINGREMANAYEEENNPAEQMRKFKLQQQMRADSNDQDMLIPDENYLNVMNYGLPPTGGWGCGIDRLAMLVAGVDRIEEVLSFGNLHSVLKN
ncbi:Lysine--tRNA ligase, mitochondrial [Candida viswanathii]|uniref:Lysyl-tRNA synthetase n=1 Tax=Candida viswanathii TaxID=5486 RepID=A0A367YI87_9ASCO|nr:Lysine--tRNA ligase, mitochondrial [Candida viswanathii]